MSKNASYLISVVPLTRIALTRDQSFFYTHSTSLPFGTLVSIEIGKRTVRGITIESKKDFTRAGGMDLKNITDVHHKQYLNKTQYALAQWMSDYYMCPLGVVLKHYAPTPTRRCASTKTPTHKTFPKPSLSKNDQTFAQRVAKADASPLLVVPPLDARKDHLLENILLQKSTAGPVLYIAPEISLALYMYELLRSRLPEDEIALLHSKRSSGAFYHDWQKAANQKTRIIIGTRGALFAPFAHLAAVLVDESHEITHKQWDMAPRYDARTVAAHLAALHDAQFLSVSATPRIQDTAQITQRIDDVKRAPALPQTVLVNLRLERYEKHRDALSRPLQKALHACFKQGDQALLFINQRGTASASLCAKCSTLLACPTCARALVDVASKMRCLHCQYILSGFPRCTACGSIGFRAVGIGTEHIEREVRSLLPQAKILRADHTTMQTQKDYARFLAALQNDDYDIIIGTQMISKGWSSARLTLAAAVDADALISSPDYTSAERAHAHLRQLQSRIAHHSTRAQLFVQTFNPEDALFQTLTTPTSDAFLAEEQELRTALLYPPAGRLVRLAVRHKDPKEASHRAKAAHKELSQVLKDEATVQISGVHAPLVEQKRGVHYKQFLIKVKKKELPQELSDFIVQRDTSWIIDIDPVHVA